MSTARRFKVLAAVAVGMILMTSGARAQCPWAASAEAEGKAQKALDAKKYPKAIAEAGKAIKLSPTSAPAYNIRGQAYLEKGDYDRAIADFTQAIKTDIAVECVPKHIADDYKIPKDALKAYRLEMLITTYTLRAKAYEKRKEYRIGKGNTHEAETDGGLSQNDRDEIERMAKEAKMDEEHRKSKAELAAISELVWGAKAEEERAEQEQARIRHKEEWAALEEERAQEKQELARQAQGLETLKELENDYFVLVEGGTFTMGCTKEQGKDCHGDEKPAHKVTVSAFYMAKFELTQKLWDAVMGSNPSKFAGDSLPVEQVSFEDVQEFITELNRLTGKNYRLPTEAEWEFAARGGNKSNGYKYSGSDTVGNAAWYSGNNGSFGTTAFGTKPVGGKRANELGIYDMSGNVFEWVNGWYGGYRSAAVTNPSGPPSGISRMYRGGSCGDGAESCRVSKRRDSTQSNHSYDLGFRLAVSNK